MKFASPQDVWSAIQAGEDVRRVRSENRALVNNAANGVPPLSPEEAKQTNTRVNCNFLEQAELHAQARRQYLMAYYRPPRFFSMTFRTTCVVPPEKKANWEGFITGFINGKMRDSLEYFELRRSTDANVVAHGPGPCAWFDRKRWLPRAVAIEDLYIPTDTKVDFSNLSWFCVRVPYTEWDLAKRVFGPNRLKGWNKEAVKKILNEYHDDNDETLDYDWMKNPEAMWELVKQNAGYYASDAVPTIPLLHLFFQDRDEQGVECWKMRVIADTEVKGGAENNEEFLYDESMSWEKENKRKKEKHFARRLSEILHCQHGDISNKAPFLYHAERSLGFMLMEPCYWSNLLLCRTIQYTFEHFNVWLRSNDPQGKARAQMVNLFDKAFLPQGISIVPSSERHQINFDLVNGVMARMKQLQGEKAATYTQQSDTGTHKEQTAFETMTKVQQVNAMMESLLITSVFYETFKYREICRRFCLDDTNDEDCVSFQKEAKKFGIPREFLNANLWEIMPEIPIGGGNPTMAMAKIKDLMAMRSQFPPEAQQEILHLYALEMSGDPRTAQRWVPLGKEKSVTSAQRDAENAFADMMATGLPVQQDTQFSPIEQLEVFLVMLGGVVDAMEKDFTLVSAQSLKGADTSANFAALLLSQIAQRKDERENAKKFAKVLGMVQNGLKGLRQRWTEQQQKQNGKPDPAAMAKAQSTMMLTQTKIKANQATTAQKLSQKDKSFKADQTRKAIGTVLDEKRKTAQLVGEEKRQNIKTANEVKRSKMKSFDE